MGRQGVSVSLRLLTRHRLRRHRIPSHQPDPSAVHHPNASWARHRRQRQEPRRTSRHVWMGRADLFFHEDVE